MCEVQLQIKLMWGIITAKANVGGVIISDKANVGGVIKDKANVGGVIKIYR